MRDSSRHGKNDVGANAYHFVTRWRLPRTTCQEVTDILANAEDLTRWWPSVYLRVETIAPGGTGGLGKRVRLLTKGFLPYRLRWEFEIVESHSPHGFSLAATGDFVGRGTWAIAQAGPDVIATYDWRITADKPLLKYLSFLLKPLFSWNHHWAMEQGRRSMLAELARRHARVREPITPS